jgi:hypothetical protein
VKKNQKKNDTAPTEWRSVKTVNLHGESATAISEAVGGIDINGHALEAILGNGWLRMRYREGESGDITEYAIPAASVAYVSFFPDTNG